jgi:hypothetical protein
VEVQVVQDMLEVVEQVVTVHLFQEEQKLH